MELSKYLKYKECHKEDVNYQNCMNNKKRWMNNLIESVDDNFGQCQTIEHLTNLTNKGTINYGNYTLYVNGKAYNASNPYKG